MYWNCALVCTVWGADFTSFFANYTLASLLSPRSVAAIQSTTRLTLIIYTRKEDERWLDSHPNIAEFRKIGTIEFRDLSSLPVETRANHWLPWQHARITGQDKFDSLVLIIPDCVYVDNFLPEVRSLLLAGDVVYYSAPQVSMELIEDELKAKLDQRVYGKSLTLSEHEIVDVFLRYINPKHAIAHVRSPVYTTHHEYAIFTYDNHKFGLSEIASHPLALNTKANALSHTFNPTETSTRTSYGKILAVSCESTFKYVEHYVRWNSHRRTLSRLGQLASWSYVYREQGCVDYSRSEVHVWRSGNTWRQSRRPAQHGHMKLYNAYLEFLSAGYTFWNWASRHATNVQNAVALALTLPTVRRRLLRLKAPLTIMMPVGGPFRPLEAALDAGDVDAIAALVLSHTVPAAPRLQVGSRFVLLPDASGQGTSALTVVDSSIAGLVGEASRGTGEIVQPAISVTEGIRIVPCLFDQ